jgi:multicomponent Na+:H+ antiporter subunit C
VLLRLDYVVTVILFSIGLYALVVKSNLIKKLIGLNIMETSVYLFFIAIGDVRIGANTAAWARAPLVDNPRAATLGLEVMTNPIPSALILTAIVVSVSVTALGLSIAVKIYKHYGTLDTRRVTSLKG